MKSTKKYPSQSELKLALEYDRDTGIFKWRFRDDCPKNWNTRYAGKAAGSLDAHGYVQISFNKRMLRAARVAYIYVMGDIAVDLNVDHKNTNGLDNIFDNLRPCTQSQNCANTKRKRNNDLPKGVWKKRNRFASEIFREGVKYRLGVFDTPEQAHVAYITAAQEHFGEFARAA